MIEVNGTRLHHHVEGPEDGPVVVLAHSLFFDLRMYDELAQLLADTHRVVRYDHRVHGGSADAALEHLDMDTLTADAAGLVDALDLRGCTFAGNSMGGFVALRLAARHPELVGGVAAIGSSAEPEGKLEEFRPLVAALQEHGGAPVIDPLLHIMFGDTSLEREDRASMVATWRERMSGLGPRIGDAAHQVIHREGVLDELADCELPVWAIAGAEDHAYEPEYSERIAATAPNGRLVVVEEAGHSVALEQPARVAGLLRELSEVAAPV